MEVFKQLNIPQQLTTALTAAVIANIIFNEIERLVTSRYKDKQKLKFWTGLLYLLKQVCCITALVLVICLNLFTYGKWV